jgi:hypothetical protein
MSMLWFRALREYDFAMRLDEDVCITWLGDSVRSTALSADYSFGLQTIESHRETVETFNPWMSKYMAGWALQPTISPLPTEDIFFTPILSWRVSVGGIGRSAPLPG